MFRKKSARVGVGFEPSAERIGILTMLRDVRLEYEGSCEAGRAIAILSALLQDFFERIRKFRAVNAVDCNLRYKLHTVAVVAPALVINEDGEPLDFFLSKARF